MAKAFEDDRLYTSDAIMSMGYMICHGTENSFAIEPGRSWPKYKLSMEGDGVYRVSGKMAKESFAEWLEGQGSNTPDAGFSGQSYPGSAKHRAGSDRAAEDQRRAWRAILRKELAKNKSAEESETEKPAGGLLGPAE